MGCLARKTGLRYTAAVNMHTHSGALPHRRATIRVTFPAALLVLAAGLAAPARGQEFPREDLEHFESKIRPVLAERCYQCHGADPERIFGGLVLVDAAGVRTGGDSGAFVVPGSPDDSLLIDVIRYDGPIRMPPDGRLPAAVVADFERWVARGAVDPRISDNPVVAARSDSGAAYDFGPGREHWAYRRMARPEQPAVRDEAWVRGPIDRFVLARLEADGFDAGRARRQAATAAAGHVRPDRPAPDPGRDRRVPGRRAARRLRAGGRAAAGVAALRRALGPALARCRPLCRLERARREHRAPERVPLPRLGHRGVQL